jgi:hypothetical protein
MRARRRMLTAFASLALALTAAPAAATTRRVERDGTGDFTTLQAAVDASAPGDVLLIGPGRYDDIHPVVHTNGVFYEVVDVRVGNLIFRGTSRDAVIVGPSQAAPDGVRWDGIVATHDTGTFEVENLTVENVYVGIGFMGIDLTVRDCSLRNGFNGVQLAARGVATFERCTFTDYGSMGLSVSDNLNAQGTVVTSCTFVGGGFGIDSQTAGTLISNCTFRGAIVGAQLSFAASGTVQDCIFQGIQRVALGIESGSQCVVTDCILESAEVNLDVTNYSRVTGTGNVLPGGSWATMTFDGQGTASLHACHILQGTGPRVRTVSTGPAHVIDLTNNYWGTTDVQQIADSIVDHNDFSYLTATVLFQPFLGQPVPAGRITFGTVKARFGEAK